MPDHTEQSYTAYLQKLTAGLPQLSAAQRCEIEQELLSHLEDLAADLRVDPADRAAQQRVLSSLGGPRTLIEAFTHAYDRRPRLPVIMSFLLNALGGGGFLALSATVLVQQYLTGAYRRPGISPAHAANQSTIAPLNGTLAQGLAGLPDPFLNTLALLSGALIGGLIMGAGLRFRQSSPDGYQVLLRASLCMLLCLILCLILYQGATGTITGFYALFGVTSLAGLLVATRIEQRRLV